MAVSENQIRNVLAEFIDPYLGKSWPEAKVIKSLEIEDNRLLLTVELGYPCSGIIPQWIAELTAKLEKECNLSEARISIQIKIPTYKTTAQQPLSEVKNIIAVASGKGGVGKSTTAVNLALALKKEGANVGILDADIYGPSLPIMLGSQGMRPESKDNKTIEPLMRYGLQSMSIGYLVEPEQAVVWRGPMASGALQQLINDTQWQQLDYLVVDLPPGTGDIQLTLSQKVPVSAALIVTTPQDIALADARKGIGMFEKVDIPVLGIVENMSTHICSNCGHEDAIFGDGGGAKLAEETGVNLLGKLPLDRNIREQTDSGCPTVENDPDSKITAAYVELARHCAAQLVNLAAQQTQSPLSITEVDD
ncbi:MAG TPA: iron-sulfur cluster carrier protein ApbC [Aeromonadales bacterium]|nr:iron-sulfur cluster carrier protein ApbC [Aeromonadales bacterium]